MALVVAVATATHGGAVAREAPGDRAAVASAHPAATAAGFEILEAGGNAFDAAVAVGAALAVAEPYGSGIGGGGFWLLHRADDGHQVMLDGRETAPAAAGPGLFLDGAGEPVPDRSLNSALGAAIPGTPAALDHLAQEYGRLPLARSLQPAIRLATDGFEVDERYRLLAGMRQEALTRSPQAASLFLDNGEVPEPGHRIRQPQLAETLRLLADEGAGAFYHGPLAHELVAAVRDAGGIWTAADLGAYEVVERPPVRARYRDLEVIGAPPPSSGGVALATSLNILEHMGAHDAEPGLRIHLVVEAMRRAYRDRAVHLGDPDFWPVPLARLTDPAYAAGLAAGIHPHRMTPSALLPGPGEDPSEGRETTHLSIIDGQGNRVAATLTVNYPFGTGIVAGDTGVLLNNEMDDFAIAPDAPNVYGLVGGAANAVQGGKRPLSSMSPTFVEHDDGGVTVLGTPGGSRIISMVLLAVMDLAEGATIDDVVARPRYHHQYRPDRVAYERDGLTPALRQALTGRGHALYEMDRRYGNMQVVRWDPVEAALEAASDPRGIGSGDVRRVPCEEAEKGVR